MYYLLLANLIYFFAIFGVIGLFSSVYIGLKEGADYGATVAMISIIFLSLGLHGINKIALIPISPPRDTYFEAETLLKMSHFLRS